jgi:hypothetical protein
MIDDSLPCPVTEQQKAKLAFFGCTSVDGLTAADASDALAEYSKGFPYAAAAYDTYQCRVSLPATEAQREQLRSLGCTWTGDITVCQGKRTDTRMQAVNVDCGTISGASMALTAGWICPAGIYSVVSLPQCGQEVF